MPLKDGCRNLFVEESVARNRKSRGIALKIGAAVVVWQATFEKSWQPETLN